MSGQFSIRYLGERLAKYLSEVMGENLNVDEIQSLIVYSDTDSVYLSLEKFVEKYKNKIPEGKTVDFLDRFIESRLQPEINKICQEIADYFNFFQNTMGAKREAIAESGIWCVHPNSQVVTQQGSVRIADMFNTGTPTGSDLVDSVSVNFPVYSFDEDNDEIVLDAAAYVFRKPYSGDMYEFVIGGGPEDDFKKFRCTVTSNHLMLTQYGWLEAHEVTMDDVLVNMSSSGVLESIRKFNYDGYVYDLNMTDHHNFFVDGICVHNCGKKRYALHVWDMEGVRYDHPKVKVTGIETQKSSTPEVVRNALLDALEILLGGTEQQLRDFVIEFEQKFKQFPLEAISFPRSVNNVEKYSGTDGNPIKGCPGHVKAAIAHNIALQKLNLLDVQPITSGDKILYCYMKPNPFHTPAMAYVERPPKEFNLQNYIDYDTQFEKAFMGPLTSLMDAVKWGLTDVSSLDDFF